ncbi:glycosyltransferase [Hydrogenovibrio halophilus]|uniref:glycosyltransferase n=1 Tax=Hydrogenovibrio halophilus TaxID=373391 RepID=UPI0003701983|nr:glycosyltransferase [Hydrogenovibrio halophilus]
MKLVIDLQGMQSESRFRGIGRYVKALIEHLIRTNAAQHQLYLLVNSHLSESTLQIDQMFSSHPSVTLLRWQGPSPLAESDPANLPRRQCALATRRERILSISPDLCFIPSLFEGFFDEVAVSVSDLEQAGIPCVVTAFDLIPYLHPATYLNDIPGFRAFYLDKLEHLRTASGWLAISDSSANELTQHLNLPPERIQTTHLGFDAVFQPATKARKSDNIASYPITAPFFIYSGGADKRKNLPKLIEAFARLSGKAQNTQLVLVGKIHPEVQHQLIQHGEQHGLSSERLIFTGYVSDSTLAELYQTCLGFVFPSWHEGFGLPALEAMACHAPVLVADATSLPEVMDQPDARFDPFDARDIAAKMQRLHDDDAFRQQLKDHGLARAQSFNWTRTAQQTWQHLEQTAQCQKRPDHTTNPDNPTLAFVTPLPPQQTGIATYSAELLKELKRYFAITLINDGAEPQLPESLATLPIQDSDWFECHAPDFDYRVYQVGNSSFHRNMPNWISRFPGTVVLHDFFLGGLYSSLEATSNTTMSEWDNTLHHAHGYAAIMARKCPQPSQKSRLSDTEIMQRYPGNLALLEDAGNVIVHADFPKKLYQAFYHRQPPNHWHTIPLVRTPQVFPDKTTARQTLNLPQADLVVCSFGVLAPSKFNLRLAQLWQTHQIGQRAQLIFVGKHVLPDYQAALEDIQAQDPSISVTGWVDDHTYQNHLAAADIAVQLRTDTRGETSAAVLDAMNAGLPTLINRNGTMAELPEDSVSAIRDDFTDQELITALNQLLDSPQQRQHLSDRARQHIRTHHHPEHCARAYRKAITEAPEHPNQRLLNTLQQLPAKTWPALSDTDLKQWALTLNQTFTPARMRPVIHIDATATFSHNHKTGIERYAIRLIESLIENTPADYELKLVKLCEHNGQWRYRSAHTDWLALHCPSSQRADDASGEEWIAPQPGDQLVTMDLAMHQHFQAHQQGLYQQWQAQGAQLHATVFDLLPIQLPDCFPPGTDRVFERWLSMTQSFDGLFTISDTVASQIHDWLDRQTTDTNARPVITPLPLGSDLANDASTDPATQPNATGLDVPLPPDFFLTVGTIEPRKGHLDVLQAFETLWQDATPDQTSPGLVIVGQLGWQSLPGQQQRNLPQIHARLKEMVKRYPDRCVWLTDVNDRQLQTLYRQAWGLIAPSLGEGLGLPLLEAMQAGLPILARDLPVFREIANDHARFFDQDKPEQNLYNSLKHWSAQPPTPSDPKAMAQKLATYRWQNTARIWLETLSKDTNQNTNQKTNRQP